MKLKRKIGISLAVAAATYCVLAYIFMWPPVVRSYWASHQHVVSRNFNFIEQYNGKCCEINLRKIDQAIQAFAKSQNKDKGQPVTFKDIVPYIQTPNDAEVLEIRNSMGFYKEANYKSTSEGQIPTCPSGGKYKITWGGEPPTCSLATNIPFKVRVHLIYWEWTNLPVKFGYGHNLHPIKIDGRDLP